MGICQEWLSRWARWRNSPNQSQPNQMTNLEILGYNDTPLTVTVVVSPLLPKSVTVSKYLLTVTLFPPPDGVTVTEDVCIICPPCTSWLCNGYSQIFYIVCVWPFQLLDYGSATLRCKNLIPSFPWIAPEGIKFCHLSTLYTLIGSTHDAWLTSPISTVMAP